MACRNSTDALFLQPLLFVYFLFGIWYRACRVFGDYGSMPQGKLSYGHPEIVCDRFHHYGNVSLHHYCCAMAELAPVLYCSAAPLL